jgi:two-component system NtrC family response regulator
MGKILIIDDDPGFCEMIMTIVEGLGHEASFVHSLAEGLKAIHSGKFDLVILDVGLPDGDGLEALSQFLDAPSKPEVIIATADGRISGAELAIRSGAWDYIEKPASLHDMRLPIVRALQYQEVKKTKPLLSVKREGFVGNSPGIRACLDLVARAAVGNASVLITGETGTGKELLALAIHENSRRSQCNFVVVDCAALHEALAQSALFGHERGAYTGATHAHEGLVKQADGGTLFLDEVGELSLSLQKVFLRILEDRKFRPLGSKRAVESDFRLIAATHRNLDEMVQSGTFREDLLYRLKSLVIELPPLRERMEDLKDLCLFFVKRVSERKKSDLKAFSEDFFRALQQYDWPGNVRELSHTMDRALTVAGDEPMLVPKHLPPHLRIRISEASFGKKVQTAAKSKADVHPLPKLKDLREKKMAEIEKEYLENLMTATEGDLDAASEISGLSRPRLYALLRRYRVRRLRDTDPAA